MLLEYDDINSWIFEGIPTGTVEENLLSLVSLSNPLPGESGCKREVV